MSYSPHGRDVTVRNGRTVTFDFPIRETLDFGDVIVVCLEIPLNVSFPDNVFAIDHEGNSLWQVKPTAHFVENSRYVSLSRHGSLVRLHNYDGVILDVEPNTGLVVSRLLAR